MNIQWVIFEYRESHIVNKGCICTHNNNNIYILKLKTSRICYLNWLKIILWFVHPYFLSLIFSSVIFYYMMHPHNKSSGFVLYSNLNSYSNICIFSPIFMVYFFILFKKFILMLHMVQISNNIHIIMEKIICYSLKIHVKFLTSCINKNYIQNLKTIKI